MRDEEIGEPALILQALEEIQDLRLNRGVEGGHGFVADKNPRIDRKSARNRHPLALAARERERTALGVVLRQADIDQQRRDSLGVALPPEFAPTRRAPRQAPARTLCLGLRVEYGSWKTIWIVRRTRARSAFAMAPKSAAAMPSISDVASGRRFQPDEAAPQRGLARARFADQADALAGA